MFLKQHKKVQSKLKQHFVQRTAEQLIKKIIIKKVETRKPLRKG
jgi:hypothetical protein